MRLTPTLLRTLLLLITPVAARAQSTASALSSPETPLQQYFTTRVSEAESRSRRDFENPASWLERAPTLRKELLGMLGLDPMPPRGDLKPVVTGRLDHEDFTVEKLHFQSLPGLYVTANLYLPKRRTGKLPAVLYVCGHSVMKEGSISFGNKTGYQHHPAWFARNSIACLAIDTIQLGEIPGLHHGTHHLNLWWWNSRGYTPAGVETWNGIRALDYLSSREEIDPERLGVTGRSGGGAYSWYIAATDERIKAAVPVAGITDLRNHIVDNVIDGHCDCMFMLNTKGWDFAKLAALVAPRPLLLSNTDKDPIFPVDGVERIHRDVAAVYRALGAKDKLGLLITEGPHKDNQELQAPAFRWFKRHLAGTPDYPAPIAEKLFTPSKLRVFDELPKDERTSTTHEWFVPTSGSDRNTVSTESLAADLRREVIPHLLGARAAWRMVSQSGDKARKTVLLSVSTEPADRPGTTPMLLLSGSGPEADALVARLLNSAGPASPDRLPLAVNIRLGDKSDAASLLQRTAPASPSVIDSVLMPRGSAMTGPEGFDQAAWSVTEKDATRIRRRFMLLGSTLDSVHVRDQVCVIDALSQATAHRVSVIASGPTAANAMLASVLAADPITLKSDSSSPPLTEKTFPDHFNLLRVTTLTALQEAADRRNSEGSRRRP